MRCIGPAGEQLGILTIEQALRMAQENGFDLVEVSPLAKPPVCKIMDYGKFKYTEKKKQSEAKKTQVVVVVKEVKFRPRTEEHDFETKIRKIREFLEESNKARVTVMFRGRELSHRELGTKVLERIVNELKEVAVIEASARMEGRQMFMILAPNPRMMQSQRDKAKAAAAAAAIAAPATAAPPLHPPPRPPPRPRRPRPPAKTKRGGAA